MKLSMGRVLVGFVGLSLVSSVALAQTSPAGTVTRQVSAEVLNVEGMNIEIKFIPGDDVRTVTIPAGRTATVDGKVTPLEKVLPGTVLTANVTWTPAPGNMTTVNGEVMWVMMPHVTMRLSDGTVHQYTVDPDMDITLDGRQQKAKNVRPGVKITAVRLKEDPITKITPDTPITGKGPKK